VSQGVWASPRRGRTLHPLYTVPRGEPTTAAPTRKLDTGTTPCSLASSAHRRSCSSEPSHLALPAIRPLSLTETEVLVVQPGRLLGSSLASYPAQARQSLVLAQILPR
jgi:hypothetical protein